MKQLAVASKRQIADVVVKNGKIINVFTHDIIEGDIAIADEKIVGIGEYDGQTIIDAKGKYVCPGLIDGHVHIESSMVTPSEFARVVVPHGVTTAITDPHEIANVAGTKGIEFMLNDSDHIPLDVYVMLPSCVPATDFEHAGATLHAEQLAPFFSHPRVLGLAEVMDYPSLLEGKQPMLAKLAAAMEANKLIDGHLAGLDETAVNVYRSANVHTDHECVTVHEALARVQRGMYVLIREGSVAKDLHKLLPAVNTYNARRFLFCTDDKHIDELVTEGSIDHHIRLAIQAGLNPLTAIQMATLNAAECYRLYTKGAIAPGYDADFLLVEDLQSFSITHVYKKGVLVAENGRATFSVTKATAIDQTIAQSVHTKKVTKEDVQIPFTRGKQANVIQIIPNHLHTKRLMTEVDVENGVFQPSIERDLLKLVVVERHRGLGVGVGIVNGFQLKKGAIASSIAHDSHNIIATGMNDDDIINAIEHIKHINGGLAVVESGRVLADLPLEISGLMTAKRFEDVLERLQKIHDALITIGASDEFNPFITLAFLALPVIPELKLTDQGLFDVSSFQFIDVEA
ncbi:adenine deaminase [Anoxybacillus flavithermus NBRC 109594]|uniref:Adenine deaminase n=1 Tax=Anoxybacillus flavithermus NBRC 109594 TaxID=1315967 RepID=R4G1L3_9BACL|nr:adenine deaminase [Anoxybacillus flavithermus]GAC91988.1 adenine deaminase [Anoxybacillus flavithermus NBRC 109594]